MAHAQGDGITGAVEGIRVGVTDGASTGEMGAHVLIDHDGRGRHGDDRRIVPV